MKLFCKKTSRHLDTLLHRATCREPTYREYAAAAAQVSNMKIRNVVKCRGCNKMSISESTVEEEAKFEQYRYPMHIGLTPARNAFFSREFLLTSFVKKIPLNILN